MTSINNNPRTPEERQKAADAITEAMRLIEDDVLLRVAARERGSLEQAARRAREGLALLDTADNNVQKACAAVDALINACEDYEALLSQRGGTDWGIRAARRMLRCALRVDKVLRAV